MVQRKVPILVYTGLVLLFSFIYLLDCFCFVSVVILCFLWERGNWEGVRCLLPKTHLLAMLLSDGRHNDCCPKGLFDVYFLY